MNTRRYVAIKENLVGWLIYLTLSVKYRTQMEYFDYQYIYVWSSSMAYSCMQGNLKY